MQCQADIQALAKGKINESNCLFVNGFYDGAYYLAGYVIELYQSDKLILNVKAEHQIDNCNDEIRGILKLLDEKAHEELQSIWSVQVYAADDEIHCVEDGILIYDEDNACR